MPKTASFYCCEKCDFKCCKLSNYNIHCLTRKHIKRTKSDGILIPETNIVSYECDVCNKKYKSRNGLWLHKKNCKKEEKQDNIKEIIKQMLIPLEEKLLLQNKIQQNETVLVPELIKQNQDYQKQSLDNQMIMFQQMIELIKQQCQTSNIITTNSNNTNNYTQFNLQVYLNETCKNAMNINKFLDYIQPTVEELEATAHFGYVEGISRIIMRSFKNLEEYELPFHCSDLKREHIYLKNPDDEWVEEKDEKPLLLMFVKEVAKRSFCNINKWKEENPQWSNYQSKQHDMFMKILNNSVSGATEEEQQANYEKIMKNIMKNTVIDKSKKNSK